MKELKLLYAGLAVLGFGIAGVDLAVSDPSCASKQKLTKKDIEEMMSSLSNWGRWGKEDELGTMNLITPQKRKEAAAEVQEGVCVSLARNVTADVHSIQYHGYKQTHLDALCHLFHEGRMYNGFSQREVTEAGAARLSVTNLKGGVFTRAVLMDMPRLWGENYLEGGKAIYPEDLDAWLGKAEVEVKRGDALLIRTGRWTRQAAEGEWPIEQDSAGLHASCLPWLKKRDVAIIGSDLSTDVFPSGVDGFPQPIHRVAIVAMGMPILDNCDLEALSEAANTRKRWAFLLTAAPVVIEGGTGSLINPVATF